MNFLDDDLSIEALTSGIRHKLISPVELTQDFLKKTHANNSEINAYLAVNEKMAIDQARMIEEKVLSNNDDLGPLAGIPICVPDVLNLAGFATTYGSQILSEDIHVDNAPEIERFFDLGMIILGKTNLSEFSLNSETENKLIGPTQNPLNPRYTVGGPNGGNGAALAAGLALLAFGVDFCGSIRINSSFCGLVGFLPSVELLPLIRDYLTPYSDRKFLRRGIIGRNIKDIEYVHSKMSQKNLKDHAQLKKTLKVGYSFDLGFIKIDSEVKESIQKAALTCTNLGHDVQEIHIDLHDNALTNFKNIIAVDRCLVISDLLKEKQLETSQLTLKTQEWLQYAKSINGVSYARAEVFVEWIKKYFNKCFEQFDVLLMPVSPTPCYLKDEIPNNMDGTILDPLVGLWGFGIPINMAALPVISIPFLKAKNGMPIGVQLVGKSRSDEVLLSLASKMMQ